MAVWLTVCLSFTHRFPNLTLSKHRSVRLSVRIIVTQEILASVMIKNLDTGEEIPLIQAEEKLPAGINPLTLHIMRRTKEYIT